MIRLFISKSQDIVSFIKTYPSDMEEKLSLKTSIYTPKRFHWIHCQKRIGLTSTNLSNTHFKGETNIRTISTSSSELEPVLIYTNPDEHKGLIAKQNKGKSGVYLNPRKPAGVMSSQGFRKKLYRFFYYKLDSTGLAVFYNADPPALAGIH